MKGLLVIKVVVVVDLRNMKIMAQMPND